MTGNTRRQQGFGIIEIMIALLLGVVIMLGVTEVATNNSKVRLELERTGRQIESATHAMRLMESDLMSAGFWGEMGEQAAGAEPPICPDDAVGLGDALGFPVQGGEGDFDCDGTTITPKTDSDFIAVRRVNSCALGTAGCAAAGGNFHLQVNSCFTPSDDTAPLPGIDHVISTDTSVSTMIYKERDDNCGTAAAAPIYRFLNRVYYVSDDDKLMRLELVGEDYVETALVDGVEMMRMEFGLDGSGADGIIDTYTDDPNDPSLTGWQDVAMVRISLVVRNLEPSGGFTDNKTYTVAGEAYAVPAAFVNHRRQVYVRTVSLRNVAGRRQG